MLNDLISRSALIAEYDRVHVGPPGGARKLMEDAPAVDAVPVVRCKECKRCFETRTKRNKQLVRLCMRKGGDGVHVNADDFCSYGKRRKANET